MIQSMTLVKPVRKLQDQFTTPEQSGMLIEMGVPDGLSADCYYELGKIKVRTYEQLYEDFFHDNGLYIPCWSVGRLIEIYCTVVHLMSPTLDGIDMVNEIIGEIDHKIYQGYDFSKREYYV